MRGMRNVEVYQQKIPDSLLWFFASTRLKPAPESAKLSGPIRPGVQNSDTWGVQNRVTWGYQRAGSPSGILGERSFSSYGAGLVGKATMQGATREDVGKRKSPTPSADSGRPAEEPCIWWGRGFELGPRLALTPSGARLFVPDLSDSAVKRGLWVSASSNRHPRLTRAESAL